MMKQNNRCYTELSKLKTFKERFDYLKLDGTVGIETFGFDRYLNQALYHSDDWKSVRDKVIIRDLGCDLGIEGYELSKYITIHHMNPVQAVEIENRAPWIFDPEFLISCSRATHNAIHYGDASLLTKELEIRKPNDTCPWR